MTVVKNPARLLRRRIAAAMWATRGRRRLRRGMIQGAIEALEASLALRPGQFRTLVNLSIAHLIARNQTEAHRALAQAREADPHSFEARAGRLLARWGFPLEVVFRMAAPPRAEPAPQPVAVKTQTRTVHARHLPYGDCADIDEYARFRAMPPISKGEMEQVDWDRVIDDLLE